MQLISYLSVNEIRLTHRILSGFDWQSLPKGSVIVDVGGGIGSTSMLLAHAYSDGRDISSDEDVPGLKFIIQDREVVVDMGEKAWKDKCPELVDSGVARFQGKAPIVHIWMVTLTFYLMRMFTVHDFFLPQPVKNAAVFLLRVVLHDWPDAFAQRILLRLREAAMPDTKLLIADFVLPLACADNFGSAQDEDETGLTEIQGAETMLAPAPLLPNLGKASANGYWMDMTVSVCPYRSRIMLKAVTHRCNVCLMVRNELSEKSCPSHTLQDGRSPKSPKHLAHFSDTSLPFLLRFQFNDEQELEAVRRSLTFLTRITWVEVQSILMMRRYSMLDKWAGPARGVGHQPSDLGWIYPLTRKLERNLVVEFEGP